MTAAKAAAYTCAGYLTALALLLGWMQKVASAAAEKAGRL